jgi:hypothetical protein
MKKSKSKPKTAANKRASGGRSAPPCCVSLLDPETAPHDGTMILADFGWPWLVPAAWSRMSCTWAVATYNASAETVTSTDVHDCWWEFEAEDNRDLKGWTPIPPVPRNATA